MLVPPLQKQNEKEKIAPNIFLERNRQISPPHLEVSNPILIQTKKNMSITQREIILKFLEDARDWVPSFHLIKNDTPYGWLGSWSDRIARYMVDPRRKEYSPEVEREQRGRYAYYRIRPLNKLF